jgi:hypothetical protein
MHRNASLLRPTADIRTVMSATGLGRVKTAAKDVGPRSREPRLSQTGIAAISGLIPTMFMTRVRL